MKLSYLGLLVPVLCAGCMYVPIGSLPTLNVQNAVLSVGGRAEIQVTAQVSAGGLSVQSVVSPFVAANIDHLLLELFVMSGGLEAAALDAQGNPVQKDIAGADLDNSVAFKNLRHDTTYRIRSYAYKAVGTAASDLISSDASSSVDVVVGRDDRPVLASIPIRLIDKVFDGQATASIVVTDGDLVDNGTETIQ